MATSLTFNYLDADPKDVSHSHHRGLFLESNRRHNPQAHFNHLKGCPDMPDDFPWFFYVRQNDTIAASIKAIPDLLYANGKTYKWAWNGDLYTNPLYRRQGVASFLYENMLEVFRQRSYFCGGTFANEISTHLSEKMGYTMATRAQRLLFLKSCRPFLNAYSTYTLLNRLADRLYRSMASAIKHCIHRYDRRLEFDYRLESIDDVHAAAFQLFDALQYPEPFHFNDSKAKLDWKIGHAADCTTYLVIENKTNLPITFFILKDRHIEKGFAGRYDNFDLMTLMHFGSRSPQERDTDAMLYFILKLFWQSDAQIFEAVSSRPYLIRRLKHKGFLKAGRGIDFFFKAPGKINFNADPTKIENWHFTHFVSDAYSFQ